MTNQEKCAHIAEALSTMQGRRELAVRHYFPIWLDMAPGETKEQYIDRKCKQLEAESAAFEEEREIEGLLLDLKGSKHV